MSNLAKLEFSPLDISGKNYMPWTIDIDTFGLNGSSRNNHCGEYLIESG
ncbi:unnamed protein product [Rhodiola kirilowii]